MKKTLFVFMATVAALAATAQTNKGQWLVGGAASFSSSKYEDAESSVTDLTFSPNAGYFFINNLAGGLRLEISSVKLPNFDANTTLLASPFVRYYFLPAAQKLNVFADAGYGFGSAGMANKRSLNQFAVSAGPAVFLTPNTALEFAVGYRSQGGEAIGNNRLNTIGLSVGFQIHLGRAVK